MKSGHREKAERRVAKAAHMSARPTPNGAKARSHWDYPRCNRP